MQLNPLLVGARTVNLKQAAFLYQLKVQPEKDILGAGLDRKSESRLLT
jgi:hypothetical protein